MTDLDLEQTLRSTLASRAATVTTAPTWDPTSVGSASVTSHHHRWLAPLAAAAVILAVAGGVLATRGHNSARPTSPGPAPTPTSSAGPAAQLPIPAGMRAVDALGVEIFVPSSMSLDGPCGDTVSRPFPHPLSAVKCAPPLDAGLSVVAFTTVAATRTLSPDSKCKATVVLGGESGCVEQEGDVGPGSQQPPTRTIVAWPAHDVAITVDAVGPSALAIIRSAHAVPVDRAGCAAADSLTTAPPTGSPALKPVRSMSVCWYLGNRLGASGVTTAAEAGYLLRTAQGATALFAPGPSTACAAIDRTDRIDLITHYTDGTSATTAFYAAACTGRPVSSGLTQFVASVGTASGIPMELNYPSTS